MSETAYVLKYIPSDTYLVKDPATNTGVNSGSFEQAILFESLFDAVEERKRRFREKDWGIWNVTKRLKLIEEIDFEKRTFQNRTIQLERVLSNLNLRTMNFIQHLQKENWFDTATVKSEARDLKIAIEESMHIVDGKLENELYAVMYPENWETAKKNWLVSPEFIPKKWVESRYNTLKIEVTNDLAKAFVGNYQQTKTLLASLDRSQCSVYLVRKSLCLVEEVNERHELEAQLERIKKKLAEL